MAAIVSLDPGRKARCCTATEGPTLPPRRHKRRRAIPQEPAQAAPIRGVPSDKALAGARSTRSATGRKRRSRRFGACVSQTRARPRANAVLWRAIMQTTGAEILIRCLQEEGVEYVFGYPGGAVLNIYDEIFKQTKVKHVLVRHEQGAVHAADGYSRSSQKVGVALVTS